MVGRDLDDPQNIISNLCSEIPRALVKGLEGVAVLFRILLRRRVDVTINRGLCGRTKSVFILINRAFWIQYCNICQIITALECISINARHAARYCYTVYTAAVSKCSPANALYTIRDCQIRQSAAAIKRASTNTRHTARNQYAGQSAAVRKCSIVNVFHTAWNRHTV